MKRDKQSKNKPKFISIFDTHGKKSNSQLNCHNTKQD